MFSSKKVDMTTGNITEKLIKVAIPIMLISFMQMAYNMTDMAWLGRLGKNAVVASGTAGFYMWFSSSLLLVSKIGVEIKVSQYTGAGNEVKAREYARSAVQLGIILGSIYTIFLMIFKYDLIQIININNELINIKAIEYLNIISFGIVFSFYNQNMSGIYYGVGNSRIPLIFSFVGLCLNMILDPVLIFGLFGFPNLGVKGAAIATIVSQLLITLLFSIHIKSKKSPFTEFHIFRKPIFKDMFELFKLGYPVGFMSGMYTIFAMIIARMLTKFGDGPIAVQRVGAQIESISWMTAGGMQSAIRSFTGQNFGANKVDRIKKGFLSAVKLTSIFGLLVTFTMYIFAGDIFKLFLNDASCYNDGIKYLQILSLSQLLMMIEMISSGAFDGLGITKYPSIIGAVFTGIRIPIAAILSSSVLLGLDGFWWTITMSSNIKGIILIISFLLYINYSKRFQR